jgi:hypothetical protein
MTVRYDESSYVKRPDLEYEYTPEMLQEIERCSQDFFYFLKYVKILHPDEGRTEFIPRDYQEEILNYVIDERFVIACCSRQSGKTTCIGAFVIWYACFHDDKYVAIGSNNAKSAIDFLSRVKVMYEELPGWLKPGVIKYNELSMKLENGTSINTAATSKNAFRGRSVNLMILDEFAHLISDKIADDFYAANFPAISESKESKLIILSTPKGMTNLFARLYKDAENGFNDFKFIHVPWQRVPGRDEKWKEQQLRAMGGDYSKFRQEFDADFIASGNTVIDPDILRKLINKYKSPLIKELDGRLLIWEKPQQGARYVIGGDPSKGTGNDYAAAQVLKVINLKPLDFEQVAAFHCNKTDLYEFAEIVDRMGHYYNTALLMIENNAEGYAVTSTLHWTHEYPNMYCHSQKIKELGIKSTKLTKTRAVLFMKRVVEDGSVTLHDRNTLEELTDFSEVKPNKFKCENINDDLISALYWATYAASLPNLLESGIQLNKRKDEDEVWGILDDRDDTDNWGWMHQPTIFMG